LRKGKPNSKWEITSDKAKWWKKYVMSIFGKKVIFTKMDKLHKWIDGRDVAWEK
jgi:hypothetical protein